MNGKLGLHRSLEMLNEKYLNRLLLDTGLSRKSHVLYI